MKNTIYSNNVMDFKTDEQKRDWLTANLDNYEKTILHAIANNPVMRMKIMAVKLYSKDFTAAENGLLIEAINMASLMEDLLGIEFPCPANAELLKTHMKSAARDMEFGDLEIEPMEKVIDDLLADDIMFSLHDIIIPFFGIWLASKRAKWAGREFMKCVVPDVQGIMEIMSASIDQGTGFGLNLEACRFNFAMKPESPDSVITLAGQTICTPGNLSTIQAPAKNAKSAVVGGIMAAALKSPGIDCDTLGLTVTPPNGLAMLHVDTEQSAQDHDRLIRRAYKRAAVSEDAKWLHSYLLTGKDSKECWSFMMHAIKEAENEHGGILMIIIDGIADFCNDPNDGKECFDLVRKLHKLAVDKNCVILAVIHENPSGAGGKTRGHLGSQLERKAETSLRLQKDAKTGVVELWVERARSCFIPKSAGVRFQWCPEAQMHLSLHSSGCDSSEPTDQKKNDKIARFAAEVTKVFEGADELTWTDLVERIIAVLSWARPTAVARIPEYVALNLIKKNDDGTYQIARSESAE